MPHLPSSDQCVGSSSIHTGCRSEKQRPLPSESVDVRFCVAEELSCCQPLEVAAETAAIDVTHCFYSSDLQKLAGCWHGDIVLLLTATVGKSFSPFLSPLGIATRGLEIPAQCQPCETGLYRSVRALYGTVKIFCR